MVRIFVILILFLGGLFLNAQNNYSTTIFRVIGDLNKDKKEDLVLVKADTLDKHHPYLLEIFFQNKEGEYDKILSSEKAIIPMFPYANFRTVSHLEELTIKNGVLIFVNQLIKGNFTHKFRYQNGNFELIGYSSNSAIGYLEFVDYNLSTGERVVKRTDLATDEIISIDKTIEKIRPLPTIQNSSPLDASY